jgi:YD repeat-containing protein
MLASSWGDPVLGIDIHWEMVPTPAPVPTPIPNPFTGVIFDPMGLAMGLALSNAIGAVVGAPFQGPVVYWGAIPATNTGTEAKHIPGHILIPPGVSWAPVPKTPKPVIHPGETPSPPKPVIPDNDAVCITGSKTVSVMGSNAVRIGDLLLSCSEPIRLPSSVVIAVPKGAPILIGGPMSLDLMAAALASLRTRFIGDSIQALLSRMKPSRLRTILQRGACLLTGHPVDVASGKLVTSVVEAELPGPLPLKIERSYLSSNASRKGALGNGWSLSLEQAVWEERGKVVLLDEEGREIELDTFDLPEHRMRAGDSLYHAIDGLTFHKRENGAWHVTDGSGVRREFAPIVRGGRAVLRRITSACENHEITFAYDTRGRLEWVRDSAGRLIGLEHDDRDRIVTLKLPLSRENGWYAHRRYEYDAQGDLVRAIDSQKHAWSYEYVTHLMVRETDRNGLSFYFEWDGLGEDAWCTRTWGDGGIHDHVLNYDKKNRVTFVTDSLGHTKRYFMNAAGVVVKIIDEVGGEATYEIEPRTLTRTLEVDELGQRTVYERDTRGNILRRIAPDGSTTTFTYHARFDVPLSTIEPSGAEWRFEYDSAGRVVGQRSPRGHWTRFEYEGGLLQRALAQGGDVTYYEHDAQKNIARVRTTTGSPSDPSRPSFVHSSAEMRLEFDRLGRPIKLVTPSGGVRRTSYDAEGRVVRIDEPHGVTRTFAHDPHGNVIRASDGARSVAYTYTGYHKLHEAHEAGTTVRFHYDTEDQLRAVENQAGERYEIELDARGYQIAERAFDGGRTRYILDALGRVIERIRPSGRASKYTYDAMSRVLELTQSDGGFERYRYSAGGLCVEAANEASEVRFEHDAHGRVVRETMRTPDGIETWVASTYDAEGKRVRLEEGQLRS